MRIIENTYQCDNCPLKCRLTTTGNENEPKMCPYVGYNTPWRLISTVETIYQGDNRN